VAMSLNCSPERDLGSSGGAMKNLNKVLKLQRLISKDARVRAEVMFSSASCLSNSCNSGPVKLQP
jgi:hypothetical protein